MGDSGEGGRRGVTKREEDKEEEKETEEEERKEQEVVGCANPVFSTCH